MTSPHYEEMDVSASFRFHPFRRMCLNLIDRDTRQEPHSNVWILRKEGWELIYHHGDLIFRSHTDYDDENVVMVWADTLGGQQVADLSPYEQLLDRWMVLERLGDVRRTE